MINLAAYGVSIGGIFRNQSEKFVRRDDAKTPLGRMANEDGFRWIAAYLASDLSRYVTGQNLLMDRGVKTPLQTTYQDFG